LVSKLDERSVGAPPPAVFTLLLIDEPASKVENYASKLKSIGKLTRMKQPVALVCRGTGLVNDNR
jgi:hypothetical protein